MFVDRVLIEVSGGDGGNGCLSFRREKYVPLGGPDGGNGGDGGSVVLVVEQGVNSLVALAHRKHWRADSGHAGKGANRHGRSAPDLRIPVPPGTLIIDAKNDFIIKDLTVPGEELIIARGGKGGYGNAHFKSSTNQAPRQTTPGESGPSRAAPPTGRP
ncbi:MAG TPA: GTPase ObgE, partial [Pirellulaceae bacterium]|nr:GTPase ObgE [Pirellulaceae bacterium]